MSRLMEKYQINIWMYDYSQIRGTRLKKDGEHSFKLHAEVMARAWNILGSLVVGVKIILQVVMIFLYVPCNKMGKNVQNQSSCGSA